MTGSAGSSEERTSGRLLGTIVVGYDGSPPSQRALELAAELAHSSRDLLVVNVVSLKFGLPDPFWLNEQAPLLDEAASLLAAGGREGARTLAAVGEDQAEGLVHAAKDAGADLLVVGTHGLGTLRRVALGSVAQNVLNYAPCSVLVVR